MKFSLTSPQNAFLTSLQGEVRTSYNKLCELFGSPNSTGDGYKVTTEWVLKDKEGRYFTIYDWKSTTRYDDGYLTVSQLRDLPEYDWHIGAKDKSGLQELINFIHES